MDKINSVASLDPGEIVLAEIDGYNGFSDCLSFEIDNNFLQTLSPQLRIVDFPVPELSTTSRMHLFVAIKPSKFPTKEKLLSNLKNVSSSSTSKNIQAPKIAKIVHTLMQVLLLVLNLL